MPTFLRAEFIETITHTLSAWTKYHAEQNNTETLNAGLAVYLITTPTTYSLSFSRPHSIDFSLWTVYDITPDQNNEKDIAFVLSQMEAILINKSPFSV
jgi:hypothetical protein